MIYTEQQLERFSKPPFKYERSQVISTHKEIRGAIDTLFEKERVQKTYNHSNSPDIEHFLQGSYVNDTNISKSSDVDIVVMLRSVWRSDTSSLTLDEKERYKLSTKDSEYSFTQFNSDIFNCLVKHFGEQYVFNDEKCIRLRNHSKFCDADIIPAFMYRLYGTFTDSQIQKFTEGISFNTTQGIQIVNYPKLHGAGLTKKSEETHGNFKETVRMFKTIRNEMIDHGATNAGIAKSYYIENLLFNVPSEKFSGTYIERFNGVTNSLISSFNAGHSSRYTCANGITPLFSNNSWSEDYLKQFLIGLRKIRDNHVY